MGLFHSHKKRINARANQIVRMVMLIVHGLKTKSYDEFIESFSNPEGEPTPLERHGRQLRFRMQISPTCWYDALVEYHATPHFFIQGGGDDQGVLISGDGITDHRIGVDFYVPTNSQGGCDALAMECALREMPGWSRYSDIELEAFATSRARWVA